MPSSISSNNTPYFMSVAEQPLTPSVVGQLLTPVVWKVTPVAEQSLSQSATAVLSMPTASVTLLSDPLTDEVTRVADLVTVSLSVSPTVNNNLPDVEKLLNILNAAPPALAVLADNEAMIAGLIAFQESAFNENNKNIRNITIRTYVDVVRSLMCGDRRGAEDAMTTGEALGIVAGAYHAGVLAAIAAAERRMKLDGPSVTSDLDMRVPPQLKPLVISPPGRYEYKREMMSPAAPIPSPSLTFSTR